MNQRVLPTWSARDGILLELNLAGQPTPESEGRVESRIGLTVTDMDAVIADLRDRGVKIAREPYGRAPSVGRQASIEDPSRQRHPDSAASP